MFYRLVRFVFTRDIEQIDDFFAEGASDIVDTNEHINIIFITNFI